MNKLNRLILGAMLALATAVPALAVDPTSMAEVGTAVSAEITANKPMVFGIFGAILGVAVLLMIFRRGKSVVR